MNLKTTLLATLGALIITAPAAVQAQPSDSDSFYYDHPDAAITITATISAGATSDGAANTACSAITGSA
ncbi:MAG TPA: hypothetical protein VGI30_04055 [Caulobacteraceae bacterium]|jgi:hypothetical protein